MVSIRSMTNGQTATAMFERTRGAFAFVSTLASSLIGLAAVIMLPALAFLALEDQSYRSWQARAAAGATAQPGDVVAGESYALQTESSHDAAYARVTGSTGRSKSSGGSLSSTPRSGLITTKQPKIISIFGGTDGGSAIGVFYSSTTGSGSPSYASSGNGAVVRGYGGTPSSGSYRTLCVRLCDGFYWPVSYATSQSGLQADEATCQASCGSPVKLFYYDTNGLGPEEAVDLRGKPYEKLRNAFRYREAFDSACKCRPDPWDETSLARHRMYAELAKQGKLALLDDSSGKKRKKSRDQGITAISVAGYSSSPSLTVIGTIDQNGQIVPTKKSRNKSAAVAQSSGSSQSYGSSSVMGLGGSTKLKASRKLAVIIASSKPAHTKNPYSSKEARK